MKRIARESSYLEESVVYNLAFRGLGTGNSAQHFKRGPRRDYGLPAGEAFETSQIGYNITLAFTLSPGLKSKPYEFQRRSPEKAVEDNFRGEPFG